MTSTTAIGALCLALCTLAFAPAADACPRAGQCAVASLDRARPWAGERAGPRLALRSVPERETARPAGPLDQPMPWIWRELRDIVEAHFPRHETPEFEAMLTPVIVAGPHDTVPGVGVSGHF